MSKLLLLKLASSAVLVRLKGLSVTYKLSKLYLNRPDGLTGLSPKGYSLRLAYSAMLVTLKRHSVTQKLSRLYLNCPVGLTGPSLKG